MINKSCNTCACLSCMNLGCSKSSCNMVPDSGCSTTGCPEFEADVEDWEEDLYG